ncbi:DUF3560 domain-containing protein [Nocardiopsis synnemataformans]|uniref:DUF3560 domain-containing protein n=1 Tax=Nocardiopsis synnemataformans TaxID=61305 RepID=UPI003EB7C1EA
MTQTIRITHTRAEGTLVAGTSKNDGTGPHLRAAGYRFSQNLPISAGWYVRNWRDKAAKQWHIDDAARRLREAGYTVEVDVDNVIAGRSFAEAEQERYDRAGERADRAETYGANASASAHAHLPRYQQMSEGWPLGQPLISDSARAFHRRMMRADDAYRRDAAKASYWAEVAFSSEHVKSFRQNIPRTLRRIEKLEADERRLVRDIDAHPREKYPKTVASWEADLDYLREKLEYWRVHVAQTEAAGVKLWRKADFVRVHGHWVQVVRVNEKSLSIPRAHLWITGPEVVTVEQARKNRRALTGNDTLITDRLPYDKIRGRMSLAEYHARTAVVKERES